MILPTKHVDLDHAVIGAGSVVLNNLHTPQTVTSLWNRVRQAPGLTVYWRFVLVLDFLYAIGAVELVDGLIRRNRP
ncbi:MAG: hypothetical protein HQL54_02550 [Magnetococcales bacterium]|nr:hypothetical protein [Magnetococcales bacterium]